jgi:catechol 2,3-dioxygenase-like lactoylglutathione lyase family enzyme
MKILSLRHIGIVVADFDRMINFYSGLGLVLRRRDVEEGPQLDQLLGTNAIQLETAKLVLEDKGSPIGYSFQLEIMKIRNLKTDGGNSSKAIYDFTKSTLGVLDLAFTVDDIAEVCDFVIANGGDLIGGPLRMPSGFPSLHCYARDPEGNVLHLAQNLNV